MATASAAVDCSGGPTEAYPARWKRLTRRHRLLTGALLAAAGHPATAGLIVPAAHRLPALFGAAVRALQ